MEGQTLHMEDQTLHIENQTSPVEGQTLHIEGQTLHMEGQTLHVEDQTLHVEGSVNYLNIVQGMALKPVFLLLNGLINLPFNKYWRNDVCIYDDSKQIEGIINLVV